VRAVRAVVAACGLLIGLLISSPLPAAYADDAPDCPPGQTAVHSHLGGWICITVTDPGSPGGPGDEGPGDGGEGPTKCYRDGERVPCSNGYGGIWNSSHNCYAFQLSPQPEPGSPLWEGHDASEGSVWGCDYSMAHPDTTWFVPGEGTLPDPGEMAERALGQMRLELADAQLAPGPEFHTYVHVGNWMWVPAEQWHDIRLTVGAGATSVTVTAEPVRVDWDMGTETKSCYDAGRVWEKGMTDAAQTTCDYAYESIENPTGDTHRVSAQIVYWVTWTCSGACLSPMGDLGEVNGPSGETTTIEVRQRQTVVTN
jgi:hypothetical protein